MRWSRIGCRFDSAAAVVGMKPDRFTHHVLAIEVEARAQALAEVRREVERLPKVSGGLREHWPMLSRAAVLALIERLEGSPKP